MIRRKHHIRSHCALRVVLKFITKNEYIQIIILVWSKVFTFSSLNILVESIFPAFYNPWSPVSMFFCELGEQWIKSKSWSSSWSHVIWFVSREATPPPHPSSQPEAYSQKLVPASLYPSSPPRSDSLPSQLVYQKHTIDKEADKDLDSTRSSGRESTEVRYLNDHPALDSIRTKESSPKAQVGMDSQQSSPCIASTPGSFRQEDSTPSTSPGSASQRLENLRRHQPDNKLEKLKERIRRQRQHLEEAAEREKLMGNLEQPLATFVETNDAGTSNKPTAKIRKVAAAPPAPIYKGISTVGLVHHVQPFWQIWVVWQGTWCCVLFKPSFYSQVSTVQRQRSGLLMGKFGRKRTSITSAENFTETCQSSLLVNTKHSSCHDVFIWALKHNRFIENSS